MQTKINLIAVLALAALAGATLTQGAVIGTNSSAAPLTTERITTLPRNEQAVWKSYLVTSQKQFRADQDFLIAELKKHNLLESKPAPKESREKRLSLEHPAEWFAAAEALHIADVIVSFQTPAGGWCKGVDMTASPRAPGGQFFGDSPVIRLKPDGTARISDWNFIGTFDNRATTTQLRFLARVMSAIGPERATSYSDAFGRGLDYIRAAQLPNGGWPQVWPLAGEYHDAVTYNDNAMVNVLELLNDVAAGKDEFSFVPTVRRQQARSSIQRGIACILKSQIGGTGQRTAWCQQHDVLNLKPTAARNYEMPSICSSESASLLLFLMNQEKPGRELVAAVHAGAAWLKKTKLSGLVWEKVGADKRLTKSAAAEPLWGRYYEFEGARPIFGDRDKLLYDDVREISAERRTGYSWYSVGPNRALEKYARWEKLHPAAKGK